MDKALYENYKSVLSDQRTRLEQLTAELKQIEGTIAALTSAIERHETAERNSVKPLLTLHRPIGEVPANLMYAGISVRWAVLCLMAEHVTEPKATTEMAEALKAGGVRSGGANFAANVSAVVSDMVRKRAELAPVADGKYEITDQGRSAWESIKRSRPYRYRVIDVASEESA